MIAGAGSFLVQALLFLVMLGAVVMFHELGHFLVAKLMGVRVEVFSFGFGRRLLGWQVGDTDYRVSLIPLGGYVRMSGDSVAEEDRTGSPREFDSRATWEKVAIMLAGPVFNLVLAVGLLAACLVLGTAIPAWLKQPVRVEFVEPGSPAAAAGLRPGDLVKTVEGREVRDWEGFRDLVLVSPGATLELGVERSGEVVRLPVPVESRTKHAIGHVGIHPCHRVAIEAVSSGSPAEASGVRAGDVVDAVGGDPACVAQSLIDGIQAGKGGPIALTLDRQGQRVDVVVQPAWNDAQGRWLIGVTPADRVESSVIERLGVGEALKESVAQNWRLTRLLFDTLGRLVTGRLSMRSMSGPVELAGFAQDSASLGLVPFLQLMSFISLNLAIFNLLPVPILDGGRIAILLVEAVLRRELRPRTKEWILQAGFAMIVLLMVVVLYFDIVKAFEG